MKYILILIGFLLLIKGADYFVEGASSIARTLRIPTLIIGLTIVAFGTSAPEAAVSITSALQGQNDIAIGNVVGSNLFNLLLVVGVAAFICPLKVKKSIIAKEFPFTLLSGVVLLILSQDILFQGYTKNSLTRADGLMLLVLFGIFLYYLIEIALTARKDSSGTVVADVDEEGIESLSLGKSSFYAIGGVIGIVIGGKIVVDAASAIALSWGMSQSLVGLTIVAVGTSLPELVTSIVASRKGQSDIALGNVIGSNIFNIFFILGISAAIHPITVSSAVLVDMVFMVIITVLAYIFAITKKSISKVEGSTLAVVYVLYMVFIIMRK